MLAAYALIALASAALTLAAPRTGHPMYSEGWKEDALLRFLSHPDHPSHSDTVAEMALLTAAAPTCTSPAAPTCKPYADDGVKPIDVRHVRPKDISTIMAIGDSITAGFGMNSGYLPFTSITEYRGLSYDIGGDNGAKTLANYMKIYSPSEKGQSTGTTALNAKIDNLNAAVSGARIADLPGQVTTLANAFNSGSYNKDGWKMLSILIGANNFCHACENNAADTPDYFETTFRQTLQSIQSSFSNTIVNAITMFNVSGVYFPQQSSSYCSFAQGILNECPCSKTDANRAIMDSYAAQYNQRIRKVAAEFANLPTFAVNVQPGAEQVNVANAGLNFLAKIDCFHPNQCSHERVSVMLWNNLFQAAGSKKSYQLESFSEPVYCPGPNDYLQ
ncbi:hypothetical protein HDU76_001936 [Blyttiomyces sp. JEL0837]|nr:hypothetical protein HDU76_001936 [Blyttiomyces sp. JEL0837]